MNSSTIDPPQLVSFIRECAAALGLSQIGVSAVDLRDAEPGLLAWLAQGFHGEMAYMAAHGLRRARPAELVPGTLSVDIARSPLMWFTGYLNQYTPAIEGGYYRTGDTVELSPDGYISFVGRNDDVITSSGYRIGPFDVESALIEHPAVIEAAVVGKPDAERTEIVKAFVVLAAGFEASEELGEELRQHVKRRLSAHAYPREIVFTEQLPKTPSGKIQRFILRNAEKAAAAI